MLYDSITDERADEVFRKEALDKAHAIRAKVEGTA